MWWKEKIGKYLKITTSWWTWCITTCFTFFCTEITFSRPVTTYITTSCSTTLLGYWCTEWITTWSITTSFLILITGNIVTTTTWLINAKWSRRTYTTCFIIFANWIDTTSICSGVDTIISKSTVCTTSFS